MDQNELEIGNDNCNLASAYAEKGEQNSKVQIDPKIQNLLCDKTTKTIQSGSIIKLPIRYTE